MCVCVCVGSAQRIIEWQIEHWKHFTKKGLQLGCLCAEHFFQLAVITACHLVMIMKLTMIIPVTFLLRREQKLHNAFFEPSYCLSIKKQYKESIKNVVPAPDPLSPMKYGSSQAKPKLHTSHSQNSNQQHTVSLTLYCITIRVGIAQEDFIYCWFQPILVVLFFNWQCCISPARSSFCWCRFCNEPVG